MRSFLRLSTRLVGAGVLLALICCSEPGPMPVGRSLYDRLGGKTAISAVIDQFVVNVVADTRINARFATADIPKLKGHLIDQVCMAMGGPCTYSGRDMRTTHAGMKISNADFRALVEDLTRALDRFKVSANEREELLDLLAPMKKDIVEVP